LVLVSCLFFMISHPLTTNINSKPFSFFQSLFHILCVLTSWTLDKRKVVKPVPTAALRVLHCQGREHPSVRETWCVSESKTPPRGGRDAVGRTRRVCSISFFLFYTCSLLYMCVYFLSLLVLSVVIYKIKFISLSLLGRTPRDRGEPPLDVVSGGGV
jgi:hypothetical protein